VRILFVLENYFPHVGGVENGFRTLCEGLVDRGHYVTVLTRNIAGTPLHEAVGGVNVIRIKSLNSRYVFTFSAVSSAIELARKHDIVHTTTYNAAPPAWLGARITRKPIVITVNETWLGNWRLFSNFGPMKAAFHEFLERAIFSLRFDRYVSISLATQRALTKALPHLAVKSQMIYYAFDSAPWKSSTGNKDFRANHDLKDKFMVLGYGRPGTSKGFEYLVAAFPLMKALVPNLGLVLILSRATQYKKEWDELKKRADPSIIFLESRQWPEIISWVKESDCVVVPSLTEGFGYTTLEASAAGTPIVASNTTSIPEVIHGRYILVTPRDANAIARGVWQLSEGFGNTRSSREFPLSDTLDSYENVYRTLTRPAVE
jgi:D-inositol-3-phosphate glycosyltransferase